MSKVRVSSENAKGDIPCVLFENASSSRAGVVVLQEWWGLNQQIQDTAKEIGEQTGFTTITPDLYRGELATNHEDAGHLMTGLDWPGAVKDIQACARHLIKLGCGRVGVTGFCMGGALTVAACCLVPEVSAGVVFYGVPKKELCDPSTIKVPIQCHFGEKDEIVGFSSPAEAKQLKDDLERGKVNSEFYMYDAPHAFTNKTSPGYDDKSDRLAKQRMKEFFKKHLC